MNELSTKILSALPHVSKPSRYLPPVRNGLRPDLAGAEVSWALLFPDAPEAGWCHHGLEILYHRINGLAGAAAERAFSPWPDMEAEMRRREIPLFTAESHHPVRDLDLFGITLQYELSSTNVLAAIDLTGLPLRADDRESPFPLVIGGGPGAMNPEPLAPFFDLFLVGEGEGAVESISGAVRRWKREGDGRKESLLDLLASIDGVYVPSLYEIRYGADGTLAAPAAGPPVRRVALSDLGRYPAPEAPVVSAIQPFHDRVYAEIARGCGVGCRFCQAGMIYRPLRERTSEQIIRSTVAAVRSTGHEDISLASLSTGDHAEVLPLLRTLNRELAEDRVGISLPSLRACTLTEEMVDEVARFRKSGFTIAPEAGSERMLRLVNKGIARDDVIRTAELAVRRGWELMKLYFLIGLPTEEADDVEGIATLVDEVWRHCRKFVRRGFRLNVSVSSLVPKPHTPFQWEKQDDVREIEAKQAMIRKRLPRNRALALKCHNPSQTRIEGVLSRGDRRLAPVLEALFRNGARFDEWTEYFSPERWESAFDEAGVDPDFYLRERREDEPLPWEHLDGAISKKFLVRERERGRRERNTPFCREECRVCRACDDDLHVVRLTGGVAEAPAPPVIEFLPPPEARVRYRFRYTKDGQFRFLSHLELGRLFRMALRRTALPIAWSQGFHPHVRIAFGPALPVGFAGVEEPIDFLFHRPVPPAQVEEEMNAQLPEGVRISRGKAAALHAKALDSLPMEMEYAALVPDGAAPPDLDDRVRRFLAAEEVLGEKRTKGKVRSVNIRAGVAGIDRATEEESLRIRARSGARIGDVLRHLFDGDEEAARSIDVRRESVRIVEEE